MRVLVVGAEGFIGRHVVAALRESGHEVVAGVRRAQGTDSFRISCDFSRDTTPSVWIDPMTLAYCSAWLGELFGDGPVGLTMWRMLLNGNVGPAKRWVCRWSGPPAPST